MGRGLVIGNRRIRVRFFIFLFLVIAGCYYIIDLFRVPPSYGIIQYGEIVLCDKGDALIIRQEDVYQAPEYGKVTFLVAEGDIVNSEDPLAILYKSNYKEELVYQLYNVQEKIMSYQQENILKDVIDKDLQKVQEDIFQTIVSIETAVRDGQMEGLDRKEKGLRSLFDKQQKVLDKKITPDHYLEQLYKDETKLNKQLEEWKIEIVAPKAGLVSFSLDGMEDLLGPKAVNYLTIEDFNNFYGNGDFQKDDHEAKAHQPFFRIIEPGKWYGACLIENSQIMYKDGQEVEVSFIGPHETTLQGKVHSIKDEKQASLVMLEFSEEVESFINIRDAKVDIKIKYQGLMVPANAIVKQRQETGIKIIQNDSSKFIKVNVIATDHEYAIIEKEGDVEGLELHTKVQIP